MTEACACARTSFRETRRTEVSSRPARPRSGSARRGQPRRLHAPWLCLGPADTLAMFALFHKGKGSGEEADKLVKQALRLAPQSVYPWHIYGIISRGKN